MKELELETSFLQCSAAPSGTYPEEESMGEIWEFGVVCEHDSGFVCKERLEEYRKLIKESI